MTRRTAGLVVAVGLTVVLVAAGAWKHQQLMDDRDAARAAGVRARAAIATTRTELERTVRQAATVEIADDDLRARAAELRNVADGVAARIASVAHERDDQVLAAFVANGQVRALRSCLDGIDRALNQVAVGDPGSVRTLESVRNACRAVS